MTRLQPGFQRAAARSGPLTERPAPRTGNKVTPLIDGIAKMDALEPALLAATSTIDLAYWQFNSALKARKKFAFDPIVHRDVTNTSQVKIRSYLQILLDAVLRGVEVRIIFSDFDPTLNHDAHFDAWENYRSLVKAVDKFAGLTVTFDKKLIQAICARHPARLEPGALNAVAATKSAADEAERQIGEAAIARAVDGMNDVVAKQGATSAVGFYEIMPGLWNKLVFDYGAGVFKAKIAPPLPLSLGSQHVKMCVIDGELAFLGGMNLTDNLLVGDPAHDISAHKDVDRHDVHLMVEGPVAHDYHRFFAGLWNDRLDPFKAYLDAKNAIAPAAPMPRTQLDPIEPPRRYTGTRAGTQMAQTVRTVTSTIPKSTPRSGIVPVPQGLALDTLAVYEDLIDNAKSYIYIENQYFRSIPLADRIERAMRKNTALEVIMVLPYRAEESLDPVTLHGNALQFQAIKKLADAFPLRFGLFTFGSHVQPANKADTFQRAIPIYIHSKTIIVDDEVALVSSANFNGRSMLVDTEIGLVWSGASSIRKFRRALWSHALGATTDQGKPGTFLSRWVWRAARNYWSPLKSRYGFVLRMVPDDLGFGVNLSNLNDVLPPFFDVYSAVAELDHPQRSALTESQRPNSPIS